MIIEFRISFGFGLRMLVWLNSERNSANLHMWSWSSVESIQDSSNSLIECVDILSALVPPSFLDPGLHQFQYNMHISFVEVFFFLWFCAKCPCHLRMHCSFYPRVAIRVVSLDEAMKALGSSTSVL